jgi:hypothetical protein
MPVPVLALARAGLTLYSINEATGVLGLPDVLGAMARLLPKIALRAHHADHTLGAEMVDAARALVPRDSGRLYNGIATAEGGDQSGDWVEFSASAVHERRPDVDYAHFVEFGTKGRAIVADENYFASGGSAALPRDAPGRAAIRRRKATGHGTPAQPFFYPAARQVLAKRGAALDDALYRGAREDSWEVNS